MSKEIKVSDLFKQYGDRNVYANNFTPSHHRNSTNNTFSTIVRSDDIKEIRLIEGYNIVDFSIEANNRCQYFYVNSGKKVDYKEITKVEEIEPSQYSSDPTFQLKKIGFTDFYQLYQYDYGLRREVELCKMAIIRG